eukprot:GHRR01019450.1.p1 GENE.GHRR01019450.1~~GHRR01019450.1.p1  ORF type:complete len:276 (+),score=52.45 GHRR01019450.1:177-1004(+)
MASQLGTPVAQPPTDGITRVRWSRAERLLTTSWDQTVRMYDRTGTPQSAIKLEAPLLDGCLQDDTTAFVGQLDGGVSRIDLNTRQVVHTGSHSDGVKCTEWLETKGLLATASWDCSLCYWDPRASAHSPAVLRVMLPGKAYSLTATNTHIIAATSGRHVHIYNLNRLDVLEQPPRESSLKYQTRCVAAFSGSPNFALGSVEGRVAMEVLDPSPAAQERKFAFKCHRRTEEGVDVVFPVNAIAHHPGYGTFATGGGDGVANIWDGNNKKRLFQVLC